MKHFFFLIAICTLLSCKTQQEITATKNKQEDLVGFANKSSFQQAPYDTWFTKNYKAYTPDITTISRLKENLKGISIKGFMGTWCGDSKRNVPRFYKILEETGFDESYFELVTVGRNKKTPDNLQEGFDLLRVPTFIFYKNGEEVGRFVERPRETMEKDILKIVTGEPYKHSYDKSN